MTIMPKDELLTEVADIYAQLDPARQRTLTREANRLLREQQGKEDRFGAAVSVALAGISLSVSDAATLTSFSEYEIRDAISTGELPAVKRGKRLAILVGDLRSWASALP